MVTNILNKKSFFFYIITILLLGFTLKSYASSIKVVQWWDEYFPTSRYAGDSWYRSSTAVRSLQYQDVNGDGLYDDAVIWYDFSLDRPLNPSAACTPKSIPNRGYRIERPSARFYGGMITRFTNASHLAGDKGRPFDRFQQATAQPMDGGHLSKIYDPNSPHNTARGRRFLIDMTVMIVDCCGSGFGQTEVSKIFEKAEDIQVNFSSVFLWKKEDFFNGGATAKVVTFDDTSLLSADATRLYLNVGEGRFIVQDGKQLWISQAVTTLNENNQIPMGKSGMDVKKFKRGFTMELNPLNSLWSIYDPSGDEALVEKLATELREQNKDFDKASTPDASYKEKSNEFLKQVDKMDFHPESATFVKHTFEDVQAVGIYFATLDFAHQTLQFVFDNFLAYAKTDSSEDPSTNPVEVSSSKGIPATAIDRKGNEIDTKTTFLEEVSVKGDASTVAKVNQSDQLDVRGIIVPETEHVGKEVDIMVVVGYKPSSSEAPESFFMFDKNGQILPWNGNINDLVVFQDEDILKEISNSKEEELVKGSIVLAPERQVRIFPVTISSLFWEQKEVLFGCERPFLYTGQLNNNVSPGSLRFFFGYRLKEEGTIVFNSKGIRIDIVDN